MALERDAMPADGPGSPPGMGDGGAAYVAAFLLQTQEQRAMLAGLAAAADPGGPLASQIAKLGMRIESCELRIAEVLEGGGGSLDRLFGKVIALVDRMDLLVERHGSGLAVTSPETGLASLVSENPTVG